MAADQLEALEGERGQGTIPDEALEPRAVLGLNTDTGVQAKTPAVIPGEHVFGVMGLQEAVAANVAEDPLSHGVLEAIQELGCETSGLVEADAAGLGLWVLVRIGPLKDAIHSAKMEMKVGIEAGAEGDGHIGDYTSWEAYNAVVQSLDHDEELWPSWDSRAASLFNGPLAQAKRGVLNRLFEEAVAHQRSLF